MVLNAAETWLVNNQARALVQRFFEVPMLQKIGGGLDGCRVLETGCGGGAGAKILSSHFAAEEVYALDIDPRQVRRASRRLSGKYDRRVTLAVGDVEHLPFRDECFDAVFDFGMLHHVPKWQTAVAEIRRVLAPCGRIFFEEVTRSALNRWLYRTFLKHPTENRFNEQEFITELAMNGISLLAEPRRILAGDIFIGVGQREP